MLEERVLLVLGLDIGDEGWNDKSCGWRRRVRNHTKVAAQISTGVERTAVVDCAAVLSI